jgi:hypothetical protein
MLKNGYLKLIKPTFNFVDGHLISTDWNIQHIFFCLFFSVQSICTTFTSCQRNWCAFVTNVAFCCLIVQLLLFPMKEFEVSFFTSSKLALGQFLAFYDKISGVRPFRRNVTDGSQPKMCRGELYKTERRDEICIFLLVWQ